MSGKFGSKEIAWKGVEGQTVRTELCRKFFREVTNKKTYKQNQNIKMDIKDTRR
jgi:hypothetical protein